MSEIVWGPIDLGTWRDVPVLTDGVATEEDVRQGRAVFYLQNATSIGARPLPLDLPLCAVLREDDREVPVIVIQAEEAEGRTYIGFRFLSGGNGVSTWDELEFLTGPEAFCTAPPN